MKIVDYFKKVRDIPYNIPIDANEEDCCCNGKARKLKSLLEQERCETRYRVCTFRWSDLNVPKEILDLQKDDVATHVYLEVLINEEWIKVDPTWDSGLKNILPVSEWDGKTDTSLAVTPIDIFSIQESEVIMSRCAPTDVADTHKGQENDFDTAFNEWLENNRA